jgi:hypothetical protein
VPVGIELGRGVFECPGDRLGVEGVDSWIVVVTDPADRPAVQAALERCAVRWRGIDGAGRFHGPDDDAFWEAQPESSGDEWHTAKDVSEVVVTDEGVEVDVDVRSFMPLPMQDAYRKALVEELTAAGVHDAVVRSRYDDGDLPSGGPPTGSWPPYLDGDVPGLPPGIPPGPVVHHELRRRGCFWNALLRRDFDDVWQAAAMAPTTDEAVPAVREVCRRFTAAGWVAGEPVETVDWDETPIVAAAARRDRAIALITCRPVVPEHRLRLPIPEEAERVTVVSAYYDIDDDVDDIGPTTASGMGRADRPPT